MDALEAIRTIRVIRKYRPDPLPDDIVDQIVNAGRRAGSSKNTQRWDFLVVRERATLAGLAKVGRYTGLLAGANVAVALVTPDPGTTDAPLSVMWDLGRAAQNMLLAAWSLRVGSCPTTVYQHDRCREILAIPADHHCEFILGFGWPADPSDLDRPPKRGGRKDLADILHLERW
jgi:nitroreductase